MCIDQPSTDLGRYRVAELPLFLIGMFDQGVTVWSQQVRALNLAYALVQTEVVTCNPDSQPQKIAIIGAGFAGLTLAAALLEKEAHAKITLLEQRDTLLPLQQGSDSRWLHPRIYNWPQDGSEASAAMLPLLNWTAARASDVVVQVLTQWQRIAQKRNTASKDAIKVVCNARHVQVDIRDENALTVEWVGEPRAVDGTTNMSESARGAIDSFDVVILATGFGLERHAEPPYWRNETFSQPSLDQPRKTFIIAGQGDGAMIDLFRLRISQYRQDRILDEIFSDVAELRQKLTALQAEFTAAASPDLFAELESLSNDGYRDDVEEVANKLKARLRRDTDVILRLQNSSISILFDRDRRISFQNRLLVYFLYKCGGFVPSSSRIKQLMMNHGIPATQVIRRFGPKVSTLLKSIVSDSIYKLIIPNPEKLPVSLKQPDDIRWEGGYFGYPRPTKDIHLIQDEARREWRKEYLPGPTSLIGLSLAASIAGSLRNRHQDVGRLRVTLHRTITVGNEEFLQQTCDYVGDNLATEQNSTAARTFKRDAATIGQAYLCRKIVRSKRGVSREVLRDCMEQLRLHATSRRMSKEVSFVLALPLLEPESHYSLQTPVAGIIYIDSTADDFYIEDDELGNIVTVAQNLLSELVRPATFDRIRNELLSGTSSTQLPLSDLATEARDALELVDNIAPPRTLRPFQFNHDYSDFATTR